MVRKILAVIICSLVVLELAAQEKALTNGMKITRSMKIKKGIYKIDAINKDSAVIIIEGEDITVDFNNVTLIGSNTAKNADEFTGIGIIVRGGRNITIRNLKARGYKIGILARDISGITIENCDLSYNYRQRLKSTQEKENMADWLSYHHNENDEWMRYGAGIYLYNSQLAIIRECKVTGGQNGLMMTKSNDAFIYNNDFSYNSGIGLGLYRSSRNRVSYNRMNFNVRGYSHGIYSRGQDSAGILVYEQSNGNFFYKNSATHSGDGFFLWAGQSTMDSGQGGCNDNVLYGNDFSYAPTNGIEVTFSRNKILNNRIYECNHGIWGGYSYDTEISGNRFRNNRIGIAIEHGQNNTIHHNIFYRDNQAIKLWSREQQPADWGYAKHRITRSINYAIAMNSFNENNVVYNLNRTDNIAVFGNTYSGVGELFIVDTTVAGIDSAENYQLSEKFSIDSMVTPPYVEKPMEPFKGGALVAGKKNIWMTEWGPYDFRYPIIWNTNPADSGNVMRFELKGPAGKWKIKTAKGLDSFSVRSGKFPAEITARKQKRSTTDIVLELEYTGPAFTSQVGKAMAANKPHIFSFRKYFKPIKWKVNWYAFDSLNNPIETGSLFPPNVRLAPIKSEKTTRLEYAWWGGIKGDTIYPRFITLAEGEANFEKGVYELGITWDDAVRVYIDDKLVVDEWNPSKYKFDESPYKMVRLNLEGNHKLRIEHLELGGFATLGLTIKPISK